MDSKVLLPTERLGRITPRQINLRFASIRQEAGLPDYLNPHCLRHTYATTLIESGWPMALVQDQLGHTHVATTAVYRAVGRLQGPGSLPEPRYGLGRRHYPDGSRAVSGPAFDWKLRELMAMRDMFSTSDLIEPLAERGIALSRSQVYRLVADTPERVTIPLLLALCDILDCQLTDLAVPVDPARSAGKATTKTARRKAVGETSALPPSAVPKSFFDRS